MYQLEVGEVNRDFCPDFASALLFAFLGHESLDPQRVYSWLGVFTHGELPCDIYLVLKFYNFQFRNMRRSVPTPLSEICSVELVLFTAVLLLTDPKTKM